MTHSHILTFSLSLRDQPARRRVLNEHSCALPLLYHYDHGRTTTPPRQSRRRPALYSTMLCTAIYILKRSVVSGVAQLGQPVGQPVGQPGGTSVGDDVVGGHSSRKVLLGSEVFKEGWNSRQNDQNPRSQPSRRSSNKQQGSSIQGQRA